MDSWQEINRICEEIYLENADIKGTSQTEFSKFYIKSLCIPLYLSLGCKKFIRSPVISVTVLVEYVNSKNL